MVVGVQLEVISYQSGLLLSDDSLLQLFLKVIERQQLDCVCCFAFMDRTTTNIINLSLEKPEKPMKALSNVCALGGSGTLNTDSRNNTEKKNLRIYESHSHQGHNYPCKKPKTRKPCQTCVH